MGKAQRIEQHRAKKLAKWLAAEREAMFLYIVANFRII
jgi:predicted GIY-YIG superfamily endonuclease